MSDYDYTKNDVPFDDQSDIDNYEIADNVTPNKTGEQIRKENVFSDVPPGDHLLMVHSIDRPVIEHFKVYVGNVLMGYSSGVTRVRFCLPDNPRQTVGDRFVLPPDDPAEMRAYLEGVPANGKVGGFQANKFFQFIEALGFPYPAGGRLMPEARRLGNWKGRTIHATVKAPEAYIANKGEKKGLEVMGFASIKFFSYRPSEATVAGTPRANGARTDAGRPASHPAPPQAPAARTTVDL